MSKKRGALKNFRSPIYSFGETLMFHVEHLLLFKRIHLISTKFPEFSFFTDRLKFVIVDDLNIRKATLWGENPPSEDWVNARLGISFLEPSKEEILR